MFKPIAEDDTEYDFAVLDRALDQVKSTVFLRPDAAFFGPLMCGLEQVWTREVDTAGVDGKHLFWNPDFFMKAPELYKQPMFNQFVLMHELWHLARLHILRGDARDGEWWNYACDIRINNDEANTKIYGKDANGKPLLPWGTFPAWYRPDMDKANGSEMAEEDIYDAIYRKPPPSGGSSCPKNPWGNGDMVGGSDPAKDKQDAIAAVVKAVQSAKMAGQPGAIPGGVQETISKFLTPIVPWENLLKKWMNDLLDYDYTWRRPNRRYPDMYLPSMYEEDGRLDHLIYFQDVSGSISNADIVRFNSELKYVWDEMKPKRMTVVQFDVIIQKIDEFHEGDTFDEIKIIGRGGTCLVKVREMIEELQPTAAIIFTDMGVAPMRKLTQDIPILWICTNNPGARIPFGKLIHIKT